MDFIDLHVHSSCSDGTSLRPGNIPGRPKRVLWAIALTDHDTVSGILQASGGREKAGGGNYSRD